MDQLPSLGTAIGQVAQPTFKIYEPLLLGQSREIKSTRRQSFAYGSHPRQHLDVYYPPDSQSLGNAASVLIFLYGGGLVQGDKINPNFPEGLVYANIGHFFSKNLGCPVVIPDYRLISHGASFPSGGQDLEMTIEWVKQNIGKQNVNKPVDLCIMGNSAGGVHLCTYLLCPDFSESRRQIISASDRSIKLKGLVLLSVPFHFEQAASSRGEVLQEYFGPEIGSLCPLGLLRARKADDSIEELAQLPILVVNGDLDPEDEILTPRDDFVRVWQSDDAMRSSSQVSMMNGHNHLSPVLSLGTGIVQEEAWGWEVVDFIRAAYTAQL